jgi:hypothetical protein
VLAGQIGRHTPDHSRALAEGDVLRHLLACMVHDNRYGHRHTLPHNLLLG